MTETPLAIIGAGLAGVTAARVAHDQGVTPLILEASDRMGGRIDGLRADNGRLVGDLGPSWVWPPYQPAIQRWLERLETPVFDQYERGDAVLDGFAAEPFRHQLPGQHGMARIVGGPSRLVEAMAAPLAADRFHYQQIVRAITTRTDGRLQIDTEAGAGVIADQVLVAVPPRLVAERMALPAGIDGSVVRALGGLPTWMAAQAKAVIRYPAPFWREQGLSGRIASRIGPLFEAHDHTSADGDAALFGFISTPPDQRDPAALRRAIVDQLTRCLGPEAARPDAVVLRDWARDPAICSAADRNGPPAHPSVGPAIVRSSHLDGRLWFCGAETADQSPGLIDGALVAGENAANAALTERPGAA